MKRIPFFVFFLCLFLPLAAGPAQVAADSPAWRHQKSDLSPDPAVTFGRLSNGFRYIMMKNDRPRDRVNVHLFIRAGSLHETKNQRGLAHFLEHMLFNGTEHFAPGELVKYFQRIGMDFGADVNGHTWYNETVYDIVLPKGDRESLAEALLVMKDYAEGALLQVEEIERERKVVLAEKRARDSVGYRTYRAALKFELPGTRIVNRPVIGVESVLKTAGRPELKNFYDTWYRPKRMVLVLVGDFSPDAAEALVRKNFADMKPRAPKQPEPSIGAVHHPPGHHAFYHHESEAGNTRVSLETIRTVEPIPDSKARRKQILLRDMAEEIVRNRLQEMLDRTDAPFTSASMASGIYLNVVRYAEISAECKPENWEATLRTLETTLRKALVHGFTAGEVERVQKEWLSDLAEAVKTAETRDSSHLARQVLYHVNKKRVFLSPKQKQDFLSPIIRAVTPESLHRAFKDTWSAAHRLILVTGNAVIQDTPPPAKIRSVYEKSQDVSVSPPVAEARAVFPYLPPPKSKAAVRNKTVFDDLGIVRLDYENDVSLVYKKTDFAASEIIFRLSFGPGRSAEPADKPGLAVLAENVVNESAFGGIKKEALNRALAGKQTRISFNIREDAFCIEGRTTPEEIELAFALLRTALVDPAFREEAYTLTRERFNQRYRSLETTIDGGITLYGSRFLAGGDGRFGLPQKDLFEQLTLADIKDWLSPYLKYPMVLAAVGDFSPESLEVNAARYLGTLTTRTGKTKGNDRAPVFPAAQELTVKVKSRLQKSLTLVAFPTDDMWNIRQTRRLNVLADVFSERLRVTVREQLGVAYSPFAFNQPRKAYPGYGVFLAMVETEPAQTDRVATAIHEIARNLATNGLTEDELQRALAPTLTHLKDIRRENDYWLDSVLTGSVRHPEKLEWSRTILPDYEAITAAELAELAETYLRPESSATLRFLPLIKDSEKKVGTE